MGGRFIDGRGARKELGKRQRTAPSSDSRASSETGPLPMGSFRSKRDATTSIFPTPVPGPTEPSSSGPCSGSKTSSPSLQSTR